MTSLADSYCPLFTLERTYRWSVGVSETLSVAWRAMAVAYRSLATVANASRIVQVRPPTSRERLHAAEAVAGVDAGGVGARSTQYRVAGGAVGRVDEVVVVAAVEEVEPRAAEELVVAGVARQRVAAGEADQRVGAVAAAQDV